MTRPANSALVTVAWLRAIPELSGIVATSLPAGQQTGQIPWASTGFAVVGPEVGSNDDIDTGWRRPILQVDFYAVVPGKIEPKWGQAYDLAETVQRASLDWSMINQEYVLKTGYERAKISGVFVRGGPRAIFGHPAGYAQVQIDLEVNWLPLP